MKEIFFTKAAKEYNKPIKSEIFKWNCGNDFFEIIFQQKLTKITKRRYVMQSF